MSSQLAKILERIDEVLAAKKFASERAWCAAAGVSPSYIGTLRSRHGTNEVRSASVEQIGKLAAAANVTVDWLMGWRGDSKDLEFAQLERNVERHGGESALERVIERYVWPDSVEPEQAAEVIRLIKQDAFKAQDPLPETYWAGRLKRLIAEAQGRAKDVHHREPAEAVDLTQESPEIQAVRKRPRRL